MEAILRRYKVRHIVALEEKDTTVSEPKKRPAEAQLVPQVTAKKPALYRQSADGDIVLNDKPIVQSTLDKLMEDYSNVADELVENVKEFIEKL